MTPAGDPYPPGVSYGPVEGRIMHRMDPVELLPANPVTRESLARDILLKLIEAIGKPPPDAAPGFLQRMVEASVVVADALLAELAKPKEGV